MAASIEKDTSLVYRTQGRDIEVITRRYLVKNALPWEATRLADPALPTFGDSLPSRAAAGREMGAVRGDKAIQVRDIQAIYAPGSTSDTEVLITYASGPNWRRSSGKRFVEWSIDSGAESTNVFVDNAGVYVPEGLQTFVPSVTIRARLEGGIVSRVTQGVVGRLNRHPFRLFGSRHVMFAGIAGRPTVSNDYFIGKNDIELEFIAKPKGWAQSRPQKDINGKIVLGTDGLPVMVEHETGEDLDFRTLFPPSFEPGYWTFFDFEFPIIP